MTQPQPIRSLVREWEERKAKMYAQDAYSYDPYATALGDIAKQLDALLDAHWEEIKKVGWSPRTIEAFEHILGKPEE